MASLLPSTTLIERIRAADDLPIARPRPGGCNVVGDFAAGGPAASRVAGWQQALEAAALPFSTLGYAAGRVEPPGAGTEVLPYDTTLLCMAGEDLPEYVARVGLDSWRDRYMILDWHWPFSAPAPSSAGEASMVSEIWVPSAFTQRALREATTRPVRLMAPPVVPAGARHTRNDLAMPNGFVFAGVAEIGRGRPGEVDLANPLSLVTAFCDAFPRPGGPSLYLALCGARVDATAEACREAAHGRADVVIAEQLPVGGGGSVIALADCYVSLHRSSAFELGLAAALASGVPVVSSRAGGPLDYLDDACAELVAVVPSTTTAVHAPYPAGLEWAEPDPEDAAAALYLVHEEPERARAKARAGAVRLGRTHGAQLAGRMVRRRLETVAPMRPEPAHAHRGRRRARR